MIFFFWFLFNFFPKTLFVPFFSYLCIFFKKNFEKEKKKKTYLPLFLTELGYGRQPNQTSNK